MTQGSFIIKKKIKDAACYAEVKLEIAENQNNTKTSIHFTDNIDSEWKIPASFGAMYAIEHLPLSLRAKSYSILFTELRGYIIDTTTTIMAFASCFAVWKALNVSIEESPSLDENKICFCFPR